MKGDGDIGKVLMESIVQMDPIRKGILTGYYYNQLTVQELSQIHNKDPAMVYQILNDTRKELRRSLKENGVKETDYPPPLSLGTELFLSYGEGAVQTAERTNKEGRQQ